MCEERPVTAGIARLDSYVLGVRVCLRLVSTSTPIQADMNLHFDCARTLLCGVPADSWAKVDT